MSSESTHVPSKDNALSMFSTPPQGTALDKDSDLRGLAVAGELVLHDPVPGRVSPVQRSWPSFFGIDVPLSRTTDKPRGWSTNLQRPRKAWRNEHSLHEGMPQADL